MNTVSRFAEKCSGSWAALLDEQGATKLNVLELNTFGPAEMNRNKSQINIVDALAMSDLTKQ